MTFRAWAGRLLCWVVLLFTLLAAAADAACAAVGASLGIGRRPACLRRERGVGDGDELRRDGLAPAPGLGRIPPLEERREADRARRPRRGRAGRRGPRHRRARPAVGTGRVRKEGDRRRPDRLGRLRAGRDDGLRLARVPDARAAAGRQPDPHRPPGLRRGRVRTAPPSRRTARSTRGSIPPRTCCCGSRSTSRRSSPRPLSRRRGAARAGSPESSPSCSGVGAPSRSSSRTPCATRPSRGPPPTARPSFSSGLSRT